MLESRLSSRSVFTQCMARDDKAGLNFGDCFAYARLPKGGERHYYSRVGILR